MELFSEIGRSYQFTKQELTQSCFPFIALKSHLNNAADGVLEKVWSNHLYCIKDGIFFNFPRKEILFRIYKIETYIICVPRRIWWFTSENLPQSYQGVGRIGYIWHAIICTDCDILFAHCLHNIFRSVVQIICLLQGYSKDWAYSILPRFNPLFSRWTVKRRWYFQ